METRRAVESVAIRQGQRRVAEFSRALGQVFGIRSGFQEGEGAAAAQLDVVGVRADRGGRRVGHEILFSSCFRLRSRSSGRYAPSVESPTSAEAAVLVADDEPQLLHLMERLTRKAGYRVLIARDGNEAVEVFGAQPDDISVVVLDAAIVPHGSRRVLESIVEKSQRVGVVLISGDVLDDPLQEFMLEHDGVYLRKPFPSAAYLQALEDSLVKGDA